MYKLKDEVNSCNVSAALAQEATAAPAVEGEVAVSKRWSALQPKLKDTVHRTDPRHGYGTGCKERHRGGLKAGGVLDNGVKTVGKFQG